MIKHILKNGTVLTDITGHKVTKEQCPTVYAILSRKEKKHEEK